MNKILKEYEDRTVEVEIDGKKTAMVLTQIEIMEWGTNTYKKLSARERLFSWPWRPWKKYGLVNKEPKDCEGSTVRIRPVPMEPGFTNKCARDLDELMTYGYKETKPATHNRTPEEKKIED